MFLLAYSLLTLTVHNVHAVVSPPIEISATSLTLARSNSETHLTAFNGPRHRNTRQALSRSNSDSQLDIRASSGENSQIHNVENSKNAL